MLLAERVPHWSSARRVRTSPANACAPAALKTTRRFQNVRVAVASPSITTTSKPPVEGEDVLVRDEDGRVVRRGPVTADLVNDHRTLFQSLLKEYAYWVEDAWVSGTIPAELCGTYFRNGPGLQIDNPRYRRHTFDGDGMVLSLAFKDGKAFFRNRFVRTEGFVREQEAGKPLFRNSFTRGAADGSLFFNPFDLKFKNVANTGVLKWAGQLYAMWEGGLPYALDPTSLETRGETRMGGALKAASNFAAHYRLLEGEEQGPGGSSSRGRGRRWVGFSTATAFGGSSVTFYEFAEDGRLLHETTEKLEGVTLPFIHDMLVSEHYYIVMLGPLDFDGAKFLTSYVLSQCSIAECLVYDQAKPSRIVLVPRPGRPSGKVLRTRVLEAPASFNFHHVNAFEVEREPGATAAGGPRGGGGSGGGGDEPLVVVDTVALDSITFTANQYNYGPDYYKGGTRSHLVRLICDPATGAVTPHRLLRRTLEFPAVDPRVVGRTHTQVWAGCDIVDDDFHWGPFQAIIRADVDPRIGLPARGPQAAAEGPVGRDGGGESDDDREEAAGRWGQYGTARGVTADIWYAGERRFPGEPMFVPRPGSTREGDGWLIAAVHNAETQKGEIVILDAQDLAAGPLATIYLPHRLPAGLHGSWDAEFLGPQDPQGRGGSEPRWRELGTIRAL